MCYENRTFLFAFNSDMLNIGGKFINKLLAIDLGPAIYYST